MYEHAYTYSNAKSQNLTSPTRSLPSLALNGRRYGNNCLTQNLERHLAQIMKEEMRQCSAYSHCLTGRHGSSRRLLQDTPGTLPPVVWHLLLSVAQETAFSDAGSVFILLCADSKWHFSHLISHRTEFAVCPAWSSIPLPEHFMV